MKNGEGNSARPWQQHDNRIRGLAAADPGAVQSASLDERLDRVYNHPYSPSLTTTATSNQNAPAGSYRLMIA